LESFLLVTLAGTTIGAIYALLGIGIVLVIRVTRVVNLAQGEFYVIGALVTTSVVAAGIPIFVAVVCAVLVASLIAAAEEVLLLRRMTDASAPIQLLTTVALAIVLSGAALLIWGRDPRTLPAFVPGGQLEFGILQIKAQGLLLIAFALAAGAGLHLFIEKTGTGRAMSAVAEDPEGAQMTGLNVFNLRLGGLMLAGALGGLAGAIALPLVLADFTLGLGLALRGFVAAVLGGLTIRGATLGGLVLGALESLTVRYASDLYRDVVVFGVLVVVILAGPQIASLRRKVTA
jgi:branched-chain amino acid transport system permease protein